MRTFKEEQTELAGLAAIIGLELTVISGSPWTPCADDWHVGLESGQLAISIRVDKSRLEISTARYPTTPAGMRPIHAHQVLKYGDSMPHISVARSRGAYAIAQDIAARLLPAYREHYAKVAAYIDRETRKHYAEHSAGKMLTRAYGKHVRETTTSTYSDDVVLYIEHGKVTVHKWDADGWRVELDIRCGLDKARRILQILGEAETPPSTAEKGSDE